MQKYFLAEVWTTPQGGGRMENGELRVENAVILMIDARQKSQ